MNTTPAVTITPKIERIILSVFVILALIYLLIGSNYNINNYDEGIVVTSAARIAGGEHPYHDFWTMYAPGEFYLLAGIMSIAGWSLIVERMLSVAIMFFSALLAYRLVRKVSNFPTALLSFSLIILFTGSYSFFARSIPAALLLISLALLCKYNFYKTHKYLWLILSAIINGFAILFRHDIGSYVLITSLIVLFIYPLIAQKEKHFFDRLGFSLVNFSLYLIGVLLIVVPAILYLRSYASAHELWFDLLHSPRRIFPQYRSLPLPVPFRVQLYRNEPVTTSMIIRSVWEGIIFYIPLIIYIFTLIDLYRKRIIRNTPEYWLRLLLSIMGIIFYSQAYIRSDIEHLFPTFFISAILIAFLVKEYWKNKIAASIFILCVLLIISVPLYRKFEVIGKSFSIKNNYQFREGAAGGIIVPKETGEKYDQLIKYIQKSIPPYEKIYVGNTNHSRITLNDAMLYFLVGRKPGTKYHDLHPGIVTSEEMVESPVIDDLKNYNVKYVILYNAETLSEPNKSSESTESGKRLDDYIRSNYTLQKVIGDYEVLKRNY